MESAIRARSMGLIFVIVAVAAGCVAALPAVGSRDVAFAGAKWPGTTLDQLSAGRGAYAKRCSGCHQLFLPTSRRSEDWPAIVKKMSADIRLRGEEAQLIERYLVTVSARDGEPENSR